MQPSDCYCYVIKGIPPSNNEYIGQNKAWQYRKDKELWADIVFFSCLEKPSKPFKKAKVTITYHFPNLIRRDPDNYSGKFLLDGLVKSRVIQDDSFSNIKLVLECGSVSKEPYTEIKVEKPSEKENAITLFTVIENNKILFDGNKCDFFSTKNKQVEKIRKRLEKGSCFKVVGYQNHEVVFITES